jgi:hypothetical protein|tara:strand:+ start:2958 stop:3119 length:162 start_codon:yes stop_codon:yes gene_type:complete
MGGRPDIIKAIVLIFAAGLVITGFTSIQASEDTSRDQEPVTVGAPAGEAVLNR